MKSVSCFQICILLLSTFIATSESRVPLSTRIINGTEATRGQFPYEAAIYMDIDFFCGGSIISDQWVLTAGHCVEPYTEFTVHLGAHTLAAEEEGRVIVTTSEKYWHPNYTLEGLIRNDIGLLRLPEALLFSEYIQPVMLPLRSQVGDTFVGAAARISGWGMDDVEVFEPSPVLNYLDVEVMDNAECNTYYEPGAFVDSSLCAFNATRSVCGGDSGSPLVLRGTPEPVQIGVTSFVQECTGTYPYGFMRITAFLDWIQQTTGLSIPSNSRH